MSSKWMTTVNGLLRLSRRLPLIPWAKIPLRRTYRVDEPTGAVAGLQRSVGARRFESANLTGQYTFLASEHINHAAGVAKAAGVSNLLKRQ